MGGRGSALWCAIRGVELRLDPRRLFPVPTRPVAMPFVGRASLDAAMAWAQRRILEHGRRAVPDPRGLSLASSRAGFRGSSIARRGAGLGAVASPGTRASGSARPMNFRRRGNGCERCITQTPTGSRSSPLVLQTQPTYSSRSAADREPAYQAAMGLPGAPVAPTSLIGAHENRNSAGPRSPMSFRSRFSNR